MNAKAINYVHAERKNLATCYVVLTGLENLIHYGHLTEEDMPISGLTGQISTSQIKDALLLVQRLIQALVDPR